MLEILLLVSLCKKMGIRARDKGLRPGLYQFFVVLAWFGGEFVGGLFAVVMCYVLFGDRGDDYLLVAYLAAFFTAGLAVWFVFKLVAIQPDIPEYDDDDIDDDEPPRDRYSDRGGPGDDRITKK